MLANKRVIHYSISIFHTEFRFAYLHFDNTHAFRYCTTLFFCCYSLTNITRSIHLVLLAVCSLPLFFVLDFSTLIHFFCYLLFCKVLKKFHSLFLVEIHSHFDHRPDTLHSACRKQIWCTNTYYLVVSFYNLLRCLRETITKTSTRFSFCCKQSSKCT